MSDELITLHAWIEKHSFDPQDSFYFLKGKTLDGAVIRSLNTKVSEVALDSYINDVRAVQKKKPLNKGIKKTEAESSKRENSSINKVKIARIERPKLFQDTLLKAIHLGTNIPSPLEVGKALKSKLLNRNKPIMPSPKSEIQTIAELKKPVVFTSNVSKDVDSAILARIQKTQQEKASMRNHYKSYHKQIQTKPVTQSPQPMKHCIKCNEELDFDAIFCSECGIEQNKIQPSENNNIKDKFIAAAKQSKINPEGYILMSEFAQTLRKHGAKWDGSFENFLKIHSDYIEFKPNTQRGSEAIKVKIILENTSIDLPKISGKSEQSNLEQILKNADKIYMDTCVLMETPVEEFFEKANSILKTEKKEIIISTKVDKELRKNAKNSDQKDPEKQNRAKKALNVLSSPENEVRMDGEDDDGKRIADQIFQTIFVKYRNEYKMLLITCDSKSAKDILNLNDSESVSGKKCMVYWIDRRDKHWNGKLLNDVKQLSPPST
jgi:hypothetical protein